MISSKDEGEKLYRQSNRENGRASTQQQQPDDIFVTNPDVHIDGLLHFNNFITPEEEASIIAMLDGEVANCRESYSTNDIDQRVDSIRSKWVKDAFSKRRSQIYEQTYDDERTVNDDFSKAWGWLIKRVIKEFPCNFNSGVGINHVQVEEIEGTSPSGPNILENCYGSTDKVYEIYLNASPGMLVSYRLPIERRNDCWQLISDTKVYVKQRTLVIRTGDCLLNWRRNVSTANKDNMMWKLSEEIDSSIDLWRCATFRHICVKMRYRRNMPFLPFLTSSKPSSIQQTTKDKGMMEVGPSLVERLTIIVTTSPIKSNPSTELLERTFDTFRLAGNDFAYKCKKIIVCDGFRCRDGGAKVTKKHSNIKQAMRNGIVDQGQANKYISFKMNLKSLIEQQKDTELSSFHNTHILELQERHGYGFALKQALQEVQTPYVCVIQHDRTFMRITPIESAVNAMVSNSKIKYIGCSMRSNLMYRDIFLSKYGKETLNELEAMCLHPSELSLPRQIYGEGGRSINEMEFATQKLKANCMALRESYFGSTQYKSHPYREDVGDKVQLSLTPTLFWYDNTHICETSHYRDFVFDRRFKMVVKGGFVEDKLSPNILKAVEREGLITGHERYGCYLLDDHCGLYFTGHLDGGNFFTKQEKYDLIQEKLRIKRSGASLL